MFERLKYILTVDAKTRLADKLEYETECALLKAFKGDESRAAERVEYWMKRVPDCNTHVIRQIMYCTMAVTDKPCADCPTRAHQECRKANQWYILAKDKCNEKEVTVKEFWKNKLKEHVK